MIDDVVRWDWSKFSSMMTSYTVGDRILSSSTYLRLAFAAVYKLIDVLFHQFTIYLLRLNSHVTTHNAHSTHSTHQHTNKFILHTIHAVHTVHTAHIVHIGMQTNSTKECCTMEWLARCREYVLDIIPVITVYYLCLLEVFLYRISIKLNLQESKTTQHDNGPLTEQKMANCYC
jgi:hypothetical protein